MVDDANVMHLPTMSGGFGKENLRHYYADVFIPGIPADTTSELIARSVGDSLLVDEFIMRMTHDQDIPLLLPGLAPTDKTVDVPTVVIVKFRGDLMESDDAASRQRRRRLLSSSFSNSVSPRDFLTCDDATFLTRCHRASVSISCHFSDHDAGAFRHSRPATLMAWPPPVELRHVTGQGCRVEQTIPDSGSGLNIASWDI
jgi:hypothetical protein